MLQLMTIIRFMEGSIYWFVLTLATYCTCYDLCSGNRNCSCRETENQKWFARCFNDGYLEFTVEINSTLVQTSCILKCNQSVSWYDAEFRLARKQQFGSNLLTVDGCSLPDESFAKIFQRLGFKNPIDLTFSSYQKLGRSLTRRYLLGLPNLSTLILNRNGLTELTNDLLRDVPEVAFLSFTSNEITSLPREIFEGLPSLNILCLDDNRIEVLDPMLFRNCTALSVLDLKNNLLTTLDHRIFHGLLKLRFVILNDNPLAIMSNDVFEILSGLQVLYMSGCRFSSLPEDLFHRLVSMQTLSLCDNRGNLTTLPGRLFTNMTSLSNVYLERNRFSRVSKDIFRGVSHLKFLFLTGNDFRTLPENIFSDSAELFSLNLYNNGLIDLPDGLFKGLNQLSSLVLSYNRITSLSTLLFADLHSLRNLDLSYNRISRIHARFFESLALLQVARFSHNFIRFPEDGEYLFQYCTNLQILLLDHNNFTSFSIKKWDHRVASTLHIVDLSYNRISNFEVENEISEIRFIVFNLRHNYMQQIPTNITSSMISPILFFKLEDNPIHCDCILYDQLMGLVGHIVVDGTLVADIGNATCASPKWMNGTRLADVNLTSFLCGPPHRAEQYIRCADECDCRWRPSDRTRVVDCSSKNLTIVPDRIMEFSDHNISFPTDPTLGSYAWRGCPTELRLEGNRLTEIPLFNESIYESVKTIFLSFNNFSVVSRMLLPPHLEVLRLDHCNLTRFEPAALDVIMNLTTLKEVNLDGNPWDCHPDTRNALLAIDNRFRRVTKYAGEEHICLDPGRIPGEEKQHQLYISYTRF